MFSIRPEKSRFLATLGMTSSQRFSAGSLAAEVPQALKRLALLIVGTTEQAAEKNVRCCHSERSEEPAFSRDVERKAGSSARQTSPGFGMTSSFSFSAACEVVPFRKPDVFTHTLLRSMISCDNVRLCQLRPNPNLLSSDSVSGNGTECFFPRCSTMFCNEI